MTKDTTTTDPRVIAFCDWLDTLPAGVRFHEQEGYAAFADLKAGQIEAAKREMARRAYDDLAKIEQLERTQPTEGQMALILAISKAVTDKEPEPCVAAGVLCAAASNVLMQNFAPMIAAQLYDHVVEGPRSVLKECEKDAGELVVECAWEGDEKRPVWIVTLVGGDGQLEDAGGVIITDTLDQAVTEAIRLSAETHLPWRRGCVDHAEAKVTPIKHGRRQ